MLGTHFVFVVEFTSISVRLSIITVRLQEDLEICRMYLNPKFLNGVRQLICDNPAVLWLYGGEDGGGM